MIAPSAIQAFLNREIDNHDWLKALLEKDIDAKLRQFSPTFFTKPFLHQKVCFLLGIEYPKFTFHADMGVGKTMISLNIIKYLKETRRIKKALVLVPNVSL